MCVAPPLLDGLGNEDEFCSDHAMASSAKSFRFFDPETEPRSIYWAAPRRRASSMRRSSVPSPATAASSRARTSLAGATDLVRFAWSAG